MVQAGLHSVLTSGKVEGRNMCHTFQKGQENRDFTAKAMLNK